MGPIKFICQNCGKEFVRRKRTDRIPRYCSRECLYEYRRNNGFNEEATTKISLAVSGSLKGKIGKQSRRWKGDKASYYAKHMWISKHYGKASKCEKCGSLTANRYEWANVSGEYKRERSDYMELCTSCHQKMDHRRRREARHA